MEERLRAQRREAEATAERSALDVANLMRAAPQPGRRPPLPGRGWLPRRPCRLLVPRNRVLEPQLDARTATPEDATDLGQAPLTGDQRKHRPVEIERAEARAAAERAAEEQAERAARDAQKTGESVVRRMAAASSAAEEAEADTADAARAAPLERAGGAGGRVAGDGTANCPPEYPIKGNRQSRIYHRPGQVSYPSTVAEYCFASEEAAESAGFRQSRARGQRAQS